MPLKLDRPLVIFDVETTGTNTETDRIIDFAAIQIHPDGHEEYLYLRMNPGMPIPAAASEIHGIRDAVR